MAMSIPPLSVSDIQSTVSTPVNISNTTSNNNGSNSDGSHQEQQQQQQQSQDQMATQSVPSTTTVSTSSAPATSPASPTQMKRKPNRRANTAERRATHNAVERQRRETLNGRFLVRLSTLTNAQKKSNSSILGPSFPSPKPFSNPTSFQIIHRQFFYSLHPCVPSSSSLGIS